MARARERLLKMSLEKPVKSVLFVCLGNICRSPTAESIFRKKSEERDLKIYFDSAGTIGNHVGEKSDPRSIKHAESRGYQMTHLARKIESEDFEKFDLILTMDDNNFNDVIKMFPQSAKSKIYKIVDYCDIKKHKLVPDPYYGNHQDFELVIEIIEQAAENFFKKFLF